MFSLNQKIVLHICIDIYLYIVQGKVSIAVVTVCIFFLFELHNSLQDVLQD